MVDVVIKPVKNVMRADTADPIGTNLMLRFQHGVHPTRVPLSLAVVMDTSGSMSEAAGGESKLDKMRKAIHRLVEEAALDTEDELILVDFDNNARRLYQGNFSDRTAIRRAIDGMEAGGGTQLATGLDEALSALDCGRHRQQQLVIFTDGEIHDAETVEGRVLEQLRRRELSVIGFGVGAEYQWQLLSRLADATGGGYHHLTTLDLFSEHLQEDLIHSKNQAIRNVTARFELANGVSLKQVVRVVPFAEMQGEAARFRLGHLRGDATTVFIVQASLPPRPKGRYRMVTVNLDWEFEGRRQETQQPVYIEYTDDAEALRRALPDAEVLEYVQQAQVQSLTNEASRATDPKVAKEKLRQAHNITRSLGNPAMERSLTQALNDLEQSGRISPETVRRCVSDARNTTRLSQFTPPPRRSGS